VPFGTRGRRDDDAWTWEESYDFRGRFEYSSTMAVPELVRRCASLWLMNHARASRRSHTDVKLRPSVYWLKRFVGFAVAAAAILGYGVPFGQATDIPPARLVSACTTWSPVDEATRDAARVEAAAFRFAERGPSAVYFRTCGSAYQYTYIDTGTGHVSCLGEPLLRRVHSDGRFVLRRCQ
jgi:hypothetical protein